MTLGDLSGSLTRFVTKKRFYAIITLNTKKDEALDEKFLSSFELPERTKDIPKITAKTDVDPNAVPGQEAKNQNSAGVEGETELPPTPNKENNTEPGATAILPAINHRIPRHRIRRSSPVKKRAPIAGGMLNGKAIYLPVPEVPAGDATGVVLVQVLL
jgi:hypothetical protein